jgi:hypothetical protein
MALTQTSAQTVIEGFEYSTADELLIYWLPSANALVDVTNAVGPKATGTNAMSVTFSFPSTPWATEFVKGTDLSSPITIGSEKYVTILVKGDPAFAAADFRNFYLYVYDSNGNFGRWGAPMSITTNWTYFNFLAGGIEKPWDSPELPDLGQIIRFALFQYGSQTAVPAYTATILVDEIAIRDTPLSDPAPPREAVVEAFEYPGDAELLAAWAPSPNAALTLSTAVSPLSTGTTALRARFNFPSTAWATEFIDGPTLTNAVSIGAEQYVTLRLKGDPAFAAADFRDFYLYVYDQSGNFGRWGTQVPTNSDWQVLNFPAKTMAKPWNSPALPDLSRIVRFAIYQYGSETARPAYTASIEVDDLQVRNTPLVEQTLKEAVIETFEYATDEELSTNWLGSPNAVVTGSSSIAPKSPGKKSMSMAFNFLSGAWVAERVRGPQLPAPLAIGPKQYLSFRVKGDPALATTDFQRLFLYAYDESGNFGRWGTTAPTNSDWQVYNFQAGTIEKPWDSPVLPNLDRIVRFSFIQYGSETAMPDYAATIYVDDLMLRNSPLSDVETIVLNAARDGSSIKVVAGGLTDGRGYVLQSSGDLSQWTSSPSTPAAGGTATWTVPMTGNREFYRVTPAP